MKILLPIILFANFSFSQEYFPLNIGNYWVYTRPENKNNWKSSVLDTITKNGLLHYIIRHEGTWYYDDFYAIEDSLGKISDPIFKDGDSIVYNNPIDYRLEFSLKSINPNLDDTTTPIDTISSITFNTSNNLLSTAHTFENIMAKQFLR